VSSCNDWVLPGGNDELAVDVVSPFISQRKWENGPRSIRTAWRIRHRLMVGRGDLAQHLLFIGSRRVVDDQETVRK
jgi:hypothetical protein